ncbi:GntR family transcriptional regulator [Rhodopila sp.]|uniref:GntR family transcriptional regulator n=1 Tax=Rhodopila sp. TaxID=2480087 RepID=UPI003D0E67DC
MLQPLTTTHNLIDRTYQQILQAIADGTLAPSQRIRQAELADSLGVSRQPVSHALHLLKRQGLVEEAGRQGLRVIPLDPLRVKQLYQVREAIDGLAARLAAQTVATQITAGRSSNAETDALQRQLADGMQFTAATPIPILVRADTDFHRAVYRLSANPAIEEITAPWWPHLMRSMATVLREPNYATRVWHHEHAEILHHILAGDPARAETAARAHAATAARLTDEQLQPQAA